MINLIVAINKDNVIGKDNQLPWGLSNDLKYFKKITTNNTVVMGRKTYESIGKALPNRKNIVISRDKSLKYKDAEIMHSQIELLKYSYEYPNENIFIIGGAEIYKLFLPYTNKLFITMIEDEVEGDTFFPEFKNNFKLENESEIHKEIDKVSGKEMTYKFTIWRKNDETK